MKGPPATFSIAGGGRCAAGRGGAGGGGRGGGGGGGGGGWGCAGDPTAGRRGGSGAGRNGRIDRGGGDPTGDGRGGGDPTGDGRGGIGRGGVIQRGVTVASIFFFLAHGMLVSTRTPAPFLFSTVIAISFRVILIHLLSPRLHDPVVHNVPISFIIIPSH